AFPRARIPPEVVSGRDEEDVVPGPGPLFQEGGDGGLGATRAQRRHVDVVEDDDEGAAAWSRGSDVRSYGPGRGIGTARGAEGGVLLDHVEAHDLLLAAVLQDREVVRGEPPHGATVAPGHDDIHRDLVDRRRERARGRRRARRRADRRRCGEHARAEGPETGGQGRAARQVAPSADGRFHSATVKGASRNCTPWASAIDTFKV